MKKTAKLTAERARELLDYDPETGVLRWKSKVSVSVKVGAVAGHIQKLKNGKRYWRIRIDYTNYQLHRVIWLIVYGRWCSGQIDHIDGNGLNNKLSNIREVTNKENARNIRRTSRNTSGATGVCWNKKNKRWRAAIVVDGVKKHLGRLKTLLRREKKLGSFLVSTQITERSGLSNGSHQTKPASVRVPVLSG